MTLKYFFYHHQKYSLITLFQFYYMAAIRLEDLCSRLDVFDTEIKQKIWTLLEYIMVHETHLIKNRHVDQLIMCSVYVVCKLSKCDKFFTEIMRCYRMQPQAASDVYRNVLLTDFSENASKLFLKNYRKFKHFFYRYPVLRSLINSVTQI